MYQWQQLTVSLGALALTLNELELEHWEIRQVVPLDGIKAIVLARKSATSYEVREAVERSLKTAEPTWIAEAREIARSGRKIEAIKYVREQTGMGLKEAKDYVESEFQC